MPGKRHKAKVIVAKSRRADVAVPQGGTSPTLSA
jgi:hypothetical protein